MVLLTFCLKFAAHFYGRITMLDKIKMERINELARKKKECGLTDDEIEEQNELRQEYLEKFRENFKAHLDCIEVVDAEPTDGVKH